MAASVETYRQVVRDGQRTGIPIASNHVTNHALGAGVAESITIPSGASIAVFSFNADIWVDFQGQTAAVPSADDTDGKASVLNPTSRALNIGVTDATTTLSIISASACAGSIEWYK